MMRANERIERVQKYQKFETIKIPIAEWSNKVLVQWLKTAEGG